MFLFQESNILTMNTFQNNRRPSNHFNLIFFALIFKSDGANKIIKFQVVCKIWKLLLWWQCNKLKMNIACNFVTHIVRQAPEAMGFQIMHCDVKFHNIRLITCELIFELWNASWFTFLLQTWIIRNFQCYFIMHEELLIRNYESTRDAHP